MQQSNFDDFSKKWWNIDGPLKLLHSMNQTRMLFIKERIFNRYQSFNNLEEILAKKTILDLGCGGGILSESLAKIGGNVTAVDKSKALIDVAKKRAIEKKLKIDYRIDTIGNLVKKKNKFDIIISLEVIEHVESYKDFLKNIFLCLNSNGIVIISTINRNFFSYLSTILVAENFLKMVPKGTHDWSMYIKPEEILNFSKQNSISLDKKSGLIPLPCGKNFKWIRTNSTLVNYILSLIN
ncbi:MAG: bifunctional 2-polyprenyl-6-hydroxyphenol methylase/3-demethylubiquinol 3-O-methyltransferase UbiG [Pseudomonadota bacterium]|nr:bifunctional 2-polyprenyl-6-hydroxyphenol methylase/3-demethylubiquinol 3-O-methyltransferase UbiG [Pseudomonadota bacterium]